MLKGHQHRVMHHHVLVYEQKKTAHARVTPLQGTGCPRAPNIILQRLIIILQRLVIILQRLIIITQRRVLSFNALFSKAHEFPARRIQRVSGIQPRVG